MSREENVDLSIIVPMYNVQDYIGICLDSLGNAFKDDVEIIVIDDGSQDDSLLIAQDCSARNQMISIYSFENGGLSLARNRGLNLAKGKYIMFVDSDDFISESFSNLKSLIKESFHDIIIYPITMFYSDGTEEFRYPMYDRVISDEELIDFLMSDEYIGSAWAAIYRRDVFREIRFPPNKIFEDNYVLPLIAKEVKSGIISSHGKYFYRQREGSIMHRQRTLEDYIDILEAHVLNLEFIKERSSTRNFNIRLYRSHFALGRAIRDYGREPFKEYLDYFGSQFEGTYVSLNVTKNFNQYFRILFIKFLGINLYLRIKHKIMQLF